MTVKFAHDGLDYVVQCQSSYSWFENIAAFNVRSIATAYALNCQKANPTFVYRVVKVCFND